MKFTRNDFLNAPGHSIWVDEQISVEESDFLRHTQVKAVPSAHVTGALHFDGKQRVTSELEIQGTMTVLDSITGDDVDVDFEADSCTLYSFEPIKEEVDEDIVVVKKDTIDINPEVFQAIVYEAPMSITRLSRDQYPKGDGWAVLSDQDPKEETDEIDPRWAKLKDFTFSDD